LNGSKLKTENKNMRKIAYICDFCKKEISEDDLHLGFKELNHLHPVGYKEACRECLDRVYFLMEKYREEIIVEEKHIASGEPHGMPSSSPPPLEEEEEESDIEL
jgi:hypothetical protein